MAKNCCLSPSIRFLFLCFWHVHPFFFECIWLPFSVTTHLTSSSSIMFLLYVFCKNTVQQCSNTYFKFSKHRDRNILFVVPSSTTCTSYVWLEFINNRHFGLKPVFKRRKTTSSHLSLFFCITWLNKFILVSLISDANISLRFHLHDLIIFLKDIGRK